MFASNLLHLLTLVVTSFVAAADLGLKFEKRAGALPTLTLPYGTYQANSFDPNGEVSLDAWRGKQ